MDQIMARALFPALFLAAALTNPAAAQSPEAALDILTRSISFRTEAGAGQVPAYAAYLKDLLVAGGFNASDITITPVDEAAMLTALWPGTDPGLKPIILLGHMDVVAADPTDWDRDPYTAVIENGYVFGRGAVDNKADVSILIATLIKLKQSGWAPRRPLILALTGDEETTMASAALLAEQFSQAEMVLNADAGWGTLTEDNQPILYELHASEKTYADYVLTVTDPGGHSSRPGPVNAIYRLSAALGRLDAYDFPISLDEITRASLSAGIANSPPEAARYITRLLADPQDAEAAAFLTNDPGYVGQIRTTCVATQIKGGHAPNALPQQATATINCRILPGVSIETIEAGLLSILADPGITIRYNPTGTFAAPASPLRADVMQAVTKAVHTRYPGLPIAPAMAAGATDSLHFRARNIPSYGVGSIFIKSSDEFSHGLNERLPLANIAPGLTYWESLLRSLAD